jgi:hypothetical protein
MGSRSSWNLESFTDELQVQGKSYGDALVWQAGVYESFDHTNGPSGSSIVFFDPTNPEKQTTQLGNRSVAVYAQSTYDLGNVLPDFDGLKFTAGYRYDWDYRSVSMSSETAGVCTAGFGRDPANPVLNAPPIAFRARGCISTRQTGRSVWIIRSPRIRLSTLQGGVATSRAA